MKHHIKSAFSVLLAVIILCLGFNLNAIASSGGTAFYVDSISGSNDNDGLSPETAWKDVEWLTEVNACNAGDKLLFRCGGTYNVSCTFNSCLGTQKNPIVISSYAEGKKPVKAAGMGALLRMVTTWLTANLS